MDYVRLHFTMSDIVHENQKFVIVKNVVIVIKSWEFCYISDYIIIFMTEKTMI